ncbi:MAG: adenylate/guanylate cyclase domain-containing protein, partial [Burkholderiaceae bacterium]|nr:adenylate/guanylate cyclase domain-containing protein [Burkholderiaceae bacterium]
MIRSFLGRSRRSLLGLALVALACVAVLDESALPLTSALDRALYDARLRAQSVAPDPSVVIVDIDERSLAAQGRWPWSRGTMAELLGAIADAGASAVGVDVVFAEVQAQPGEDEALARRIAGRPIVLGYYFSSDRDGQTSGTLPPSVTASQALREQGHSFTTWTGYGANLHSIQAAAAGAGFFNPVVDSDGVVRALPLLAEFDGRIYESLAVSVLRRHLGQASLELLPDVLRLAGERATVEIPLSDGLSALVPFAGTAAGAGVGSGRFEYVSAAEVLAGRVNPDRFRGRVVLVGTSAPGLTDLRATPVSAVFPGVEIHATLVAAALDPSVSPLRQRSDLGTALGLASAALLGATLAIALPLLGAMGVVLLSAISLAGLWIIASIAWANFGLVIPLAAAVLLVAALVVLNMGAGYFIEGRARRAVAGLFGEYVSPALVERMMRDPCRYASQASENRELTIMFVDIRGFTRIAETMQPEALREYINTFLTAISEVVHRYGGTVDKYIGDAVMSFWGAPIEDPQHADHAVAAALSMLDEVQRLNLDFEARGLPLIRIGVGVNTGVVRVGDMGSKLRRAYTVIGDAVNLASRLEGLTKEFDAPIIVGETTMTQARNHGFTELGRARVNGRHEPV